MSKILKVKRIDKKWWIVGDMEDGPYGPYDTKVEANEDCRGVMQFFEAAEKNQQKFFTTTPVFHDKPVFRDPDEAVPIPTSRPRKNKATKK